MAQVAAAGWSSSRRGKVSLLLPLLLPLLPLLLCIPNTPVLCSNLSVLLLNTKIMPLWASHEIGCQGVVSARRRF